MSYLALLGLVALIGLLNLTAGLVLWLASPYGLISAFVVINLLLCAFRQACPPVAILRSLCTRAGCLSR